MVSARTNKCSEAAISAMKMTGPIQVRVALVTREWVTRAMDSTNMEASATARDMVARVWVTRAMDRIPASRVMDKLPANSRANSGSKASRASRASDQEQK